MNLRDLFTAHPRTVGETYGEHCGVALSFAGALLIAGLACAVHAVAPFLFTQTASRAVDRLHQRMVTGRVRKRHSQPTAPA